MADDWITAPTQAPSDWITAPTPSAPGNDWITAPASPANPGFAYNPASGQMEPAGRATPPAPPPQPEQPGLIERAWDTAKNYLQGNTDEIAASHQRITEAARQGWEDTPNVLSPETEAKLRQTLGRGADTVISQINAPAVLAGGANALFKGGQQGLVEFLTPIIGPQGARDVAAFPEAFPLAGHELGLSQSTALHDIAAGRVEPPTPQAPGAYAPMYRPAGPPLPDLYTPLTQDLNPAPAHAPKLEAPGTVRPPEPNVTPTTPERPGDLAAQVNAMADPDNPKDSVFVATGNEAQIPDHLPTGVTIVTRPEGTLLTIDPEKAKLFSQTRHPTDSLIASFLGYPETKPDAMASGNPQVVQGKDAEGNIVTSSIVSPENVPEAVGRAGDEAPHVEVTTPIAAQQERAGPRVPPAPNGPNPYGDNPHAAALWQAERSIVGPESGGRANAQNPVSSAGGLFQITNSTWDAAMRDMGLPVPQTAAERAAQKYDPALNTAVMREINSQAATHLDSNGLPVTPETLQAAHRLGPAGAESALRAFYRDPDAPLVGNGLSPDAVKGNGDISHLTVGEFLRQPYPHGGSSGVMPPTTAPATPAPAASAPEAPTMPPPMLFDELSKPITADVPGAPKPETPTATEAAPNAGFVMMDPSQLTVDPERFQYKAADERGVTGALQGVDRWEPALANPITAWQDEDGQTFVVNGHQRTDLALRAQAAGQPDVQVPARIFRAADGYTPDFMRTLGAYQNIAEGSGTPIDAARVLRGKDALPAIFRLPDLPPRSQMVQQARGLANLSDQAFGAVANGVVQPAHAAQIGMLISDPTEQMAALDVLARAQPANAEQARLMVEDIRNSGFLQGEQTTLFGDETFAQSLIPERAKVLDAAMRTLRGARGVFRAAISGEETLTGAGNTLDREANVAGKSANEQTLDTIQRDAVTRGPLSDALTESARELAGGKPISGVASHFLARARDIERSGKRAGVQRGDHAGGEGYAGERGVAERRGPLPPSAGPDLFGGNRALAARREPEPTIRSDQRQRSLEGTEPSAIQAQAARDQQGRGALLPKAEQKPANEGLFARPEPEQPRLPEPPRTSLIPDVGGRDLTGDFDHSVEAHRESRNWTQTQGGRTGHEYLTAVDAQTGRVIHAATSDKQNFAAFDSTAVRGMPVNSITIHHNHPSKLGLSPGDIAMAATPQVREVVAHAGPDLLSVSIPEKLRADWTDGQLNNRQTDLLKSTKKANDDVLAMLRPLVQKRIITADEADLSHYDLVARLLHARGIIDYVTTRDIPPLVRQPFGRLLSETIDRDRRVGSANTVQLHEGLAGLRARDGEFATREGTGDVAQPGNGQNRTETARAGPLIQQRLFSPDRAKFNIPDGIVPGSPEADEIASTITRPRQVKNLNPIEAKSILPRTLASLDDMSATFWNRWMGREAETASNIQRLRDTVPTLRALPKASRLRVAAALELHRIQGEPGFDPAGNYVQTNTGHPSANWSKLDETIHLTPAETKAYHETVALGAEQWSMLMRGAARRFGWDGAVDPAAIRTAALGLVDKQGVKRLGRLAELLDIMRQHQRHIYFPMQRFGQHFIAVYGHGVEAMEGRRRPVWFETIEKPAAQDFLGKTEGALTIQPIIARRLAALKQQFPADRFYIENGDFVRNPDLLHKIDLPALQKLMMQMESSVQREIMERIKREAGEGRLAREKGPAGQSGFEPELGMMTKEQMKNAAREEYERLHGATVDAFYDSLFEELKAGYRRQSRDIPGYSDNFDRSLGSHMYQIARNTADQVHRDAIESAWLGLDAHPHQRVRQYWKQWRDYQEDPGDPLARAASGLSQYGFAWMLGMNPSSTLIVGLHTPMAAAPVLSVGVGPMAASGALRRGFAAAYSGLRFDTKNGAHIDLERAIKGMSPDKQAFMRQLGREGALGNPGAREVLGQMSDRQAEAWEHAIGATREKMRHALNIATSNISAVDEANRLSIASAAWDLASDPARLKAMSDPLLAHNAIYRQIAEDEGPTRENFTRFMTGGEAAFQMGRENKAPAMRGALGTLWSTLHGFQIRYLSTALRLMKNMGREGKLAAALMMGGLALGAGSQGLPFVEDIENAANAAWRHFAGYNPDIKSKLHDFLSSTGLGSFGADLVLHGPVSMLTGADIGSRIGFGDVISREADPANVIGTVPSIVWNAYTAARQRWASGQPSAAIGAEIAPAAFRGPLRVAAENQQGVVSRSGTPIVPPDQIGTGDKIITGLGFTPMTVTRQREATERYFNAQQARPSVDSLIQAGDAESLRRAVDQMKSMGWSPARVRDEIRQIRRAQAVGHQPSRQFQRFEQLQHP